MNEVASDSGFGKRLGDLRVQSGLSLPKLAQRAGISKGYLWQLENNPAANPSIAVIQKLATGLRISVAELLDVLPRNAIYMPATPAAETLRQLVRSRLRKGTPIRPNIVRSLAGFAAHHASGATSQADWAHLAETCERVLERRAKAGSELTKDDWAYIYESILLILGRPPQKHT